jgi:hypothetical protein
VDIQLDPGDWNLTVFAIDLSDNVLGHSDTQSVTVPGQQTHALDFTENAAFTVGIEIESLERLRQDHGRVHYFLVHAGSVDVSPGLSVEGIVGDPSAVCGSLQDYQLQRGVAVGGRERHWLISRARTRWPAPYGT